MYIIPCRGLLSEASDHSPALQENGYLLHLYVASDIGSRFL